MVLDHWITGVREVGRMLLWLLVYTTYSSAVKTIIPEKQQRGLLREYGENSTSVLLNLASGALDL